jgi:hypothetical protein
MALSGALLTVVPPALYGVTLGMVGSARLPAQSSLNETYKHGGTAVYALLAGVTAYYGGDYMVFVLVALSALAAAPLVLRIRPHMIDDDRARGLLPGAGAGSKAPSGGGAVSYSAILSDRGIAVLLLSVLLFHLGNAAMLPLLSQLLALGDSDTGILVTAVNICIAQLLVIPAALLVGQKADSWGTKRLFLLGALVIPLRGVIVLACLHHPADNTLMLISTQLLDGVSAGLLTVCTLHDMTAKQRQGQGQGQEEEEEL